MSKRSALGRGLGALIPEGAALPPQEETPGATEPASRIRDVPVDVIALNPHQPRHQIDAEALQELAASIAEHGLIQPLVVSSSVQDVPAGATSRPAQYTLIAGERRLRASKLAGLDTVPVLVKEATPREMLELALVENIQRADLNPLEEAGAYQQLSEVFGLTQQEIADQVGKNRVSVANALRLLQLPDFGQDALAAGQISEGHARALLGLREDLDRMRQALDTVIKQQLSVRQTEELVRRWRTEPVSPKATRTVSPETRALESEFAKALGTKVDLSRSKKGGRLTIHFYSDEELQSLYDIMVERRHQ
jgi:ParB family chromosome partitioning protein